MSEGNRVVESTITMPKKKEGLYIGQRSHGFPHDFLVSEEEGRRQLRAGKVCVVVLYLVRIEDVLNGERFSPTRNMSLLLGDVF